jgi:hypothetical protein
VRPYSTIHHSRPKTNCGNTQSAVCHKVARPVGWANYMPSTMHIANSHIHMLRQQYMQATNTSYIHSRTTGCMVPPIVTEHLKHVTTPAVDDTMDPLVRGLQPAAQEDAAWRMAFCFGSAH